MTEVQGNYRGRFQEACGDVFVDKLVVGDGVWSHLEQIFKPGVPKGKRLRSGLSILKRIAPPFVNRSFKRYLSGETNLPFSQKDYSFEECFDSGGANKVFLLESREKSKNSLVLKVNRANGPKDCFARAAEQKREYEEIKALFASLPGLVVEEHHLVVHGPRKKGPVAAVIQTYLGNNFKDVFTEIPKEELVLMLGGNPEPARTVRGFVAIFESHPQLLEKELDLLGRRNLSVLETEDGPSLILLDPHYRQESGRGVIHRERIGRRLDYLKNSLDQAEKEAV